MNFVNGFVAGEDVFGVFDLARKADRGGLSVLNLLPDSPAKEYFFSLVDEGAALRGVWNADIGEMPLSDEEKKIALTNRSYKASSEGFGRHCAETMYRLVTNKVALLEAFWNCPVAELHAFACEHGAEMPDWF